MRCEQAIQDELAEKYVTARLAEPLQEEFEIHILECPRCRNQVEVLQGLQGELAARPAEIPARRVPGFGWPRWAWSAVAALVVLGAVVTWVNVESSLRHAPTAAGVPTAQSTTAQEEPTLGASAPQPSEPASQPGSSTARTYTEPPLKPRPGAASANVPAKRLTKPEPEAPGSEPALVAAGPPVQAEGAATAQPEKPGAVQLPSSKAPAQQALPLELAAELFRLGQVEPPPYTFAGFGSRGKQNAGTGPVLGAVPAAAQAASRQVFANAMAFYIEGRYSAALPLLEQTIATEPVAPDARFFLGVCRLLLGHSREAIDPLAKTIQLGPSLYREAAHFYLAKAYIQVQDLAQAEEQLRATIALHGRLRAEASGLLTRLQALRPALENVNRPEGTPKPD